MTLQSKNRTLFILGLVGLNIFLDQITKIIVRVSITLHEQIEVIGKAFIVTKVENEGAFLSMGSDMSPLLRSIVFSWLPAIVMLGILYYLITQKESTRGLVIGISMMVGGGIGNLIDRIAYGSVTDFLFIDLGGWAKTGVFNIADVSITAGCILIVFASLRKKKEPETTEESSDSSTISESETSPN